MIDLLLLLLLFDKGEIKSTPHVVDLNLTGEYTINMSLSLIFSILYPDFPAITSLNDWREETLSPSFYGPLLLMSTDEDDDDELAIIWPLLSTYITVSFTDSGRDSNDLLNVEKILNPPANNPIKFSVLLLLLLAFIEYKGTAMYIWVRPEAADITRSPRYVSPVEMAPL